MLKLVKFMVFTQKIPKKIGFVKSEKFHLELAWYLARVIAAFLDWYSWTGRTGIPDMDKPWTRSPLSGRRQQRSPGIGTITVVSEEEKV